MSTNSGDIEPEDSPAPETTLEVPAFSEVETSEVGTRGPGGFGVWLKGRGSPEQLFRMVVPVAITVIGLIMASAAVIAGRPFWQAAVIFLVALGTAFVCRVLRMPKAK